MHFYGLKLHTIGFERNKSIPFPEYLLLAPANVHDLVAVKPVLETLRNRTILADKAYCDKAFNELLRTNNSEILTPVKSKKGEEQWEKNMFGAASRLVSKAISSFRQPIESFINWIQVKTNIQHASNVHF